MPSRKKRARWQERRRNFSKSKKNFQSRRWIANDQLWKLLRRKDKQQEEPTTKQQQKPTKQKKNHKNKTEKMITRRNWLLKCSILVNIAVLLYICSHVMVGNNTNNFGVSGSGSASYLIQQLAPTSHQQSTQQQKSSISSAQALLDEQELAAILRNKEIELQKQIKMQEASQVSFF